MKCRLCDSSDLEYFYSMGNENQFKYYKCKSCSLVNLDLINGYNQEKYTENYLDVNEENHKSNIDQTASYRFISKNIKDKKSIMDIGCGNGRILYLAKNEGWKVNGLELSQKYADKIKKELDIDIRVGNFLELNFEPDFKFDVVVLRHVLEHLPDPHIAMNKINQLVEMDGHAVLEFPNINGIDLKAKRFLTKLGLTHKKYSENFKPGHVNEYCKESFTYLVQQKGFYIKKWETYSSKKSINLIHNNIHIGNKVRTLIQKQSSN